MVLGSSRSEIALRKSLGGAVTLGCASLCFAPAWSMRILLSLDDVRNAIRSILEYLGGHGIGVLVAVLILVAGSWGFVALLDEVKEGDTQHFDDWAVRTLGRYNDVRWLEEVGRDFTALGGVGLSCRCSRSSSSASCC